MPTLNLSVTDEYTVQGTLPLDTAFVYQNTGSNDIEIYIGPSAPSVAMKGVILKAGQQTSMYIDTGELCYTRSLESGTISTAVAVY